MSLTSRGEWVLTIVLAASVAVAACGGSSTPTVTGPATGPGSGTVTTAMTAVEMTVNGGFACVCDNQQLEIGFLNRTAHTQRAIPQSPHPRRLARSLA
jgi:hypothetical protein